VSKKPALELLSARAADRQGFARIADRVRLERVRIVLSRNGVPVAAVLSVEDLKRYEQLEAVLDKQTVQPEVT
jgi:prevent-host-death family protein